MFVSSHLDLPVVDGYLPGLQRKLDSDLGEDVIGPGSRTQNWDKWTFYDACNIGTKAAPSEGAE